MSRHANVPGRLHFQLYWDSYTKHNSLVMHPTSPKQASIYSAFAQHAHTCTYVWLLVAMIFEEQLNEDTQPTRYFYLL